MKLKAALIAQCHELGLTVAECAPWGSSSFNIQHSKSNIVYLPGWRTHAELPRFYAHAGAFVHPAISEPWGLVVNETTASGLPVLLSPGTGAAATLLVTGRNGETLAIHPLENCSSSLQNFADNYGANAQNHSQASRAVLAERSPTSGFGAALVRLSSV